jgi:hypothetical protein
LLLHSYVYLDVAVTRSVKNLWFFDESSKREPFVSYFTRNHSIRLVSSEDLSNSPLAKKTAPEVWVKRGVKFFEQDNFSQARKCFVNGGELLRVRDCDARILVKKADDLNARGKLGEAKELILKAAIVFRDELNNNQVYFIIYNLTDSLPDRCFSNPSDSLMLPNVSYRLEILNHFYSPLGMDGSALYFLIGECPFLTFLLFISNLFVK